MVVLLVNDGDSVFFVGDIEPAVALARETRTIVEKDEDGRKSVVFQDSDGYIAEWGYADTFETATRYALGALFAGRDDVELFKALQGRK